MPYLLNSDGVLQSRCVVGSANILVLIALRRIPKKCFVPGIAGLRTQSQAPAATLSDAAGGDAALQWTNWSRHLKKPLTLLEFEKYSCFTCLTKAYWALVRSAVLVSHKGPFVWPT